MFDVHSHFLNNVDDGSNCLGTSIKLLKEEQELGIEDVIITPHYREGLFETPINTIKEKFEILKKEAEKENIGINLYLGQEVLIRSEEHFRKLFKERNDEIIITLNNTNYILLEFSYTDPTNIIDICYLAKAYNYIPIIAHIERYEYLDIDDYLSIKESGALIQVNASTIADPKYKKDKKKVMKAISYNLIDFIASDMHQNRTNNYKNAYELLSKKIDKEMLDKLFIKNKNLFC